MEAVLKITKKDLNQDFLEILKHLFVKGKKELTLIIESEEKTNPFLIPLSIDEFKQKLEEGLAAYKKGNFLTHDELLNDVSKW